MKSKRNLVSLFGQPFVFMVYAFCNRYTVTEICHRNSFGLSYFVWAFCEACFDFEGMKPDEAAKAGEMTADFLHHTDQAD